MDREEKRKRDAELDQFWDIDALIPAKRAPHKIVDTTTAEIVLEPRANGGESDAKKEAILPQNDTATHFIPPHTADEIHRRPAPELEYQPDNALIRTVRLYRWRSNYRYYETFLQDAIKLYPVKGQECPRVAFFSYVPQYNQMTRAQLEWYLWWREQVRVGVCPDTDYSYILLYAFELINLSGKMDPLTAQGELCKIWIGYRDIFHQLDSYLPEWICDYSLIHRLPPPDACTGERLCSVMSHCTLKEFYVPGGGEDGYIRALLAFCSNYDYRKSKFCTGDRQELFDSAIKLALQTVTRHLSDQGRLFATAGMDDSRLTRDAYTGALCSYRIKRKIEVEYCSFSRSHELRFFVTDVVKYTENKLRAALGIRSRLTVYALPVSIRNLLDDCLDAMLPKRTPSSTAMQQEPAPYEKLYDLPRQALSLDAAAEIEQASWKTTEQLVEAFADTEDDEAQNVDTRPMEEVREPLSPPAFQAQTESDSTVDSTTDFAPYLAFLRAVWEKDPAAQRRAAQALGMPCEVVADEINGLAATHLGDIILEEDGHGFSVIEDYFEVVEQLLDT